MSICVCGRIQRKCLDEDSLEKFLVGYFSPNGSVVREIGEKCVTYEGLNGESIISASFVREEAPPYNVYESAILKGEFEHAQSVTFDLKKEEATMEAFQKIILFFVWLVQRTDSDVLVTSDVHDELCLVRKTEILWSQDLSHDYGAEIGPTSVERNV